MKYIILLILAITLPIYGEQINEAEAFHIESSIGSANRWDGNIDIYVNTPVPIDFGNYIETKTYGQIEEKASWRDEIVKVTQELEFLTGLQFTLHEKNPEIVGNPTWKKIYIYFDSTKADHIGGSLASGTMTFHHSMIYIAGDATESSVLESIRAMITKSIGFSGLSLAETDSVFNESTILESPVLSFSNLDKKIIAGRYALSKEQEIANDLRANILNLNVDTEIPLLKIYSSETSENDSKALPEPPSFHPSPNPSLVLEQELNILKEENSIKEALIKTLQEQVSKYKKAAENSEQIILNLQQQLDSVTSTPFLRGWVYSEHHGWVYTDQEIYPYIYLSETSSWYFYEIGSSKPARYFNYSEEYWEVWE